MVSPVVLEYVAALPLGSHAIHCYSNKNEVAQIFDSYLQGGLERDEAVHLITPNHETYTNFLQATNVNIESLENDKRLGCVLIADFLLDKDRLSSTKALHSALKLIQEDEEFGFKGTRTFTTSTEPHYSNYGSPSDLLQYERELGRSFNLPLSAVCTYSARGLVDVGLDDLLLTLFKPHGQIIFRGLACAQGEQTSVRGTAEGFR